MFELIPNCEERNFRLCEYNGKAVGMDITNRNIFEKILQKSKIDYYLCPRCKYLIIGSKYNILSDTLNMLFSDSKEVSFKSINGEIIVLNKSNFLIICDCNQCINPDAWVKEYKP